MRRQVQRMADFPQDFFVGFHPCWPASPAGSCATAWRTSAAHPGPLRHPGRLEAPTYSADITAAVPRSKYLLIPGAGYAVVIGVTCSP